MILQNEGVFVLIGRGWFDFRSVLQNQPGLSTCHEKWIFSTCFCRHLDHHWRQVLRGTEAYWGSSERILYPTSGTTGRKRQPRGSGYCVTQLHRKHELLESNMGKFTSARHTPAPPHQRNEHARGHNALHIYNIIVCIMYVSQGCQFDPTFLYNISPLLFFCLVMQLFSAEISVMVCWT